MIGIFLDMFIVCIIIGLVLIIIGVWKLGKIGVEVIIFVF